MKGWLFEYKLATEEEVKAIETDVRKEMDDAVEWAKNSPDPEAKELFTHVYKEVVPVRAVEMSNSFKP